MTAAVIALAAVVVLLVGALLGRADLRLRPRRRPPGPRRILVPFTGGTLEPSVLDAAIRLARAEDATLVPAYLLVMPLQYSEESPLADEVGVAMPWLEAVEQAAARAGVAVDARIEKGRIPTHALRRLWEVEQFDRIVAPAPANGRGGLSLKDLTWILSHAPAETLVLRPAPARHDQHPSDGLEPSTPSLQSSNEAGTAGTTGKPRARKPRQSLAGG